MTVEQALLNRRSIRGFLDEKVPEPLIARIFGLAQLAPSNCNVQPWTTHVVSGEALARMRQALTEVASRNEPPTPDIELTPPYRGIYRERQVEAARALFSATGVERGDLEARSSSMLRNFQFFDAPHAAFIFLPSDAGWREALDVGIYVQSLMLLMTENGLASCAQGALSHYAATVRQVLEISDEFRLIVGMSFGLEDVDHSANGVRTNRAPIASNHVFHL
ncbi:nitroreductase [Novosphingobium aquae]|uniref:Nitroreductase n=1 Tax=Novosphingobium aquae TaxID=3133435 RepID=A0ABU8S665_9SPHN